MKTIKSVKKKGLALHFLVTLRVSLLNVICGYEN
jgi:hypothetical protein